MTYKSNRALKTKTIKGDSSFVIDAQVKETCKNLYFRNFSPLQISKYTGLSKDTIDYWIHGKRGKQKDLGKNAHVPWKVQKKDLEDQLVEVYKAAKEPLLKEISTLSLGIIREVLYKKAKDPHRLSLDDAKTVSQIFSNIDRIVKLDAGEVTERIAGEVKVVTLEDLRKAIEHDDFIDVTPKKEIKE